MFDLQLLMHSEKLESPETPTNRDSEKKSLVLVLDDDVSLAKGLGHILKTKEMDSVVMYNSIDAYEFMRLKKVDLLITDLSIPAYGGKDLMSSLMDMQLDTQLPIIIYSGNLYPKTIMELRKILHNHDYFFYEKPGDIDHLCDMVKSMLVKQEA